MSDAYRIDFNPLFGRQETIWSTELDEMAVTLHAIEEAEGESPKPFEGVQATTAQTGVQVVGKAALSFWGPPSRISFYMRSIPGMEATPPRVQCVGRTRYEGEGGAMVDLPADTEFGPRAPYPASRIYAAGTPMNDEQIWYVAYLTHGIFYWVTATEAVYP